MMPRGLSESRRRSMVGRPRNADAIGRRWQLEDVGLERLDRAAVADDWLTFRIVATASFIETGSDLYAHNLVEFFAGDTELGRWLAQSWEPEELRHGAALRAYVERVWPSFDWPSRFRAFMDEYSSSCTIAELEPTRALELAARCIVEMGTSALYRSIHAYAPEGVLGNLAALIYADEVRHYKTFLRHFHRYQRSERPSRTRVGRTLVKRLLATSGEDGRCAYRHIWDFAARKDETFETSYRAFGRDLTRILRRHAPSGMLARMTLKPLELPAPVVGAATLLSGPIYRLWLSAAH